MGLDLPKFTRIAAAVAVAATPAITACSKATHDECVALEAQSDLRGFPFDSDAVGYEKDGDRWTAAFDVPEDELVETCNRLPFRAQVRGTVWRIEEGDTMPTLHADVALSDAVTFSDIGPHVLAFDGSGLEDVVSLRVRVQLPSGETMDTPEHLVNAGNPLRGQEFPATAEPGEDRDPDAIDDLPDPAGDVQEDDEL